MDWKTFFTTEAISNYIIFGAGLISGLCVWAIKTWILPRPMSKVFIEKVQASSLIDIATEVRNDVVVTYKGSNIGTFHQTILLLSNRGDDIIDNIDIIIKFDKDANILDKALEDNISSKRKSDIEILPDKGAIHVKFDFINPYRPYKDEIALKVYAPKPLGQAVISGGGRGWTVRYADRVAYNDMVTDVLATSNSSAEALLSLTRIVLKSTRIFPF